MHRHHSDGTAVWHDMVLHGGQQRIHSLGGRLCSIRHFRVPCVLNFTLSSYEQRLMTMIQDIAVQVPLSMGDE